MKSVHRLRQITTDLAMVGILFLLAVLVFDSFVNEALPLYVGF